ncbi:signal peptidase II [Mediterraneibacter agrestimuris]|uniref:signal peptidase II n=1 Tax=Mediterraneibacter agrestimuris TaxID=2941333 RepID=UPI00203E00C2|nr:signal peptidase II [Mediterraneibacter agrestimuris]
MKVKILKSYLYAFVWIVVLVAADQFTKWLAVVNLKNQDSFILIPDIFELQYLENRGAAFGMFQGKQFLFTIGAVFVSFVILFFYRKIPSGKRFFPLKFCAVLICAGAIGNMIDRIFLNYVIDFFYFSLIDFPIFNVADCYVVIACFLFAILILFIYKDDELSSFSLKFDR